MALTLDDGFDEILALPKPPKNPSFPDVAAQYNSMLHAIRIQENIRDRIGLYTNGRFIALKKWLIESVGPNEANEIMEKYV